MNRERMLERKLDPPEPKAVHSCQHCCEDIREGDKMAELDGAYYHLDCFQEAAFSILQERFGAAVGVAGANHGCF